MSREILWQTSTPPRLIYKEKFPYESEAGEQRGGSPGARGILDAGRRQGPHQAHGLVDDLRTGRHHAVVSHPTAAVTLVGTPQSCHGHAPRRAWPSMAASVVLHKVTLTDE